MKKLSIRDLSLKGKRCLIRVDYNVPLSPSGEVTDDTRIRASLETLTYARQQGARLVLVSHLGRPDGKVVEPLRMDPAARRLGKLLGIPIQKSDGCIGEKVFRQSQALKEGEILLLENVRFHPEEEKNDPGFAKALAQSAELFVNDAFGTAHRAHASTVGVTQFLPSAMGFLMEKEVAALSKVLFHPEKPFAMILGGAKVSDKVGVLESLIGKVDLILIGGAMAYTFLKVQGVAVGRSRVEEDKLDVARSILQKIQSKKITLVLPGDHLTSSQPIGKEPLTQKQTRSPGIPDGEYGYDIGPETVRRFTDQLKKVRTVLWNGPLGVFEQPLFAEGTREVARFLAGRQITSVIGGGDTVAAVTQLGFAEKMTHVSTGGGASLEFLEGKTLPGIAALTDKEKVGVQR